MGLFGKGQQANPKEMVTEWTHKLRKEGNNIERQIRGIQREEEKTKRMIKDSAKRGEMDSCRILAKEIVKADKQINKLYASKAHLNSVQMSMKHQLSTLRVAGALAKSTEVMQSMQQLIKVPEIQATMRDMSKEMMKAGIIEEMLEDTMETLEDDDLEEEADEEVDKVLYEITAGELGKAPAAVEDSLPALETEVAGARAKAGPSRAGATAVALEEDDDEDIDEMKARLEALRS
ncbi:charged multivesicular body protein 3 [Plakobranchus ocellatus]|uniref:Charged multivesicular body protein 3 n=1 Tax=Plakobranchus ocellatus TaxID=259542 RepID=A0AAV3YEV0_9GAST|nr:charged multivesicular body protein 3 [Plakobranchus ocellatus]